jgi:small subunit ribosomal protein S20
MPITIGAKKAHRASERKKVFNIRRKRTIKDVVKNIEKLLKEGKADEARKELPKVYKALDKAAKMNTLKKNNVSRKKSRISAAIKKVANK